MENKLPKTKYTPTDALIEALNNSELLLVHSTEYGLEIKKDDIKILTDAKEAFENEMWTKEIEIEFWIVYKNLSKLITPVNIDSLKAAQETKIKQPNLLQKLFRRKRRRTIAHRSVRFYTAFSIFTMFLMLIIYIFFFIGTIRLNRIQKCNERMAEIDDRLDEIMLITGIDNKNPSAELEYEQLLNEYTEIDDEKNSNIYLIEGWLLKFKAVLFVKDREKKEDNIEKTNTEPGPPDTNPTDDINSKIGIIQEAQNYVIILGLYILPLFFGLLGAIAFVLRDLVNQTRKMLFSKELNINYTLRLILGTLAGLAVGLFWGDIKQQESFIFMESLGPLLIAFLSGLSVEYVFSGIEKLVANFINKGIINGDKK